MINTEGSFLTSKDSQITIGDHCSINIGTLIQSDAHISIGNSVAIVEHVSVRDIERRFHPDHGVRGQGFKTAPIIIKDDCWIGRCTSDRS